jgi:hypothetical protein
MTEDTKGIVKDLLPRARAGEVQWRLGEEEEEFVVNLPDFSVTVSYVRPSLLRFSVRDADGYALINETVVQDEDYAGFQVLWELYQEARRNALNIPAKLKALRDQLKKPGAIGSTS